MCDDGVRAGVVFRARFIFISLYILPCVLRSHIVLFCLVSEDFFFILLFLYLCTPFFMVAFKITLLR